MTTETRLIDVAWSKPSPAAVKAAGYHGVIGYISHGDPGERVPSGGSPKKDLSAAQAKRYRDAGLVVGLVFETTADRAKGGNAAGREDCAFAEAEAAKRGYPLGCVIFYAVDFDATARQILPYFRGIKATHARYGWGPYGSATVVNAVHALKPTAAWQTVAWSGGVVSPHADVYQRSQHTRPAIKGVVRAAYDEDVLIRPVPLWGAAAKPPHKTTPKPKPAPHHHKPAKKEPKVKHAIKRKSKALAALVGGVVTWVTAALSDGHVSTNEWRALVAVLVPAVVTYFAPKNAEPKAKRPVTDRGHFDVVGLLVAALIILVLLVILVPVLRHR